LREMSRSDQVSLSLEPHVGLAAARRVVRTS